MVRKLQSESVLANPSVLFNLASTAINQVTQGQLVLSKSLTNPTLMVQIAMAVKDVAYEDIVFVQYPTVYSSDYVHVLPVTDAADVLFEALRENKALTLTGEASGGYGVEVTGEAEKPTPTPTATADADAGGSEATASPTSTPSPTATAKAEERVELPSEITGTTAAQVTCTVPEG